MKYHLSSIMRAAWRLYRKGAGSFSLALRTAWANEKARHSAQRDAGVAEEAHTWAGWRRLGYEVRHGSRAMYHRPRHQKRHPPGLLLWPLPGAAGHSVKGGGHGQRCYDEVDYPFLEKG